MPPHIDPLRPTRAKAVPTGREWLYELKLDGFRGVLTLENGRASFTSKNGNRMPRFQELADALARSLKVKDAVLDGEIVVMRPKGPDFLALFFRRGRPAYVAFDLLWRDGRDLRGWPLWRRKKALQKLIDGTPIGFVEAVEDPGLFLLTQHADWEGIVAKRRGDPYAPETTWIKVKHRAYSQMIGRWELFDRRRKP